MLKLKLRLRRVFFAKSKEVILAVHLMRELMKFYELEYTIPIFENETNIRENIARETILKEFNLLICNSFISELIII